MSIESKGMPVHHVKLACLIVILGTVWGLNVSLMKVASLSGLSFTLLAVLTIFGNLVIFAALSYFFGGRIRIVPQLWWFFAACGCLGYVLPFFLELFAVPRIGAAPLAIIISLAPMMTLLIAAATGTEKMTRRRVMGICVGFLSVSLIALQDLSLLSGAFGIGLLAAIFVPFIYGSYHVFIARFWPDDMEPFEIAMGESLYGLMLVVPIYALWSDIGDVPPFSFSTYWIVGALLIFSLAEVWLYFQLMRMGGPTYVSQSGYIAVVAGVLWASVFFGETVTPWLALSIFLSLSALLITGTGKQEAEVEAKT
jgi:drug/metabolite transporter (DMT)-like permease